MLLVSLPTGGVEHECVGGVHVVGKLEILHQVAHEYIYARDPLEQVAVLVNRQAGRVHDS